jgi:hypothetical protein
MNRPGVASIGFKQSRKDPCAQQALRTAHGPLKQIEDGDTIIVPLDADQIRPLTRWTSIAQIIYQLGLAAAAAKAVGVF